MESKQYKLELHTKIIIEIQKIEKADYESFKNEKLEKILQDMKQLNKFIEDI